MDVTELQAEFQLLKLEPGATLKEVEKAFQRLKALYAENSLASYSLFDEDERCGKLVVIERAYERIVQFLLQPQKEVCLPVDELPVREAPNSIDVNQAPGLYLSVAREKAGRTFQELCAQTKIGRSHMENIEAERFEKLPAPVYLRGFILEYAKALGLSEAEEIARIYLERFQQYRASV